MCRSAHSHVRALHHIRKVLTDDMAKTIAAFLIQSHLDYTNSVLHGSTNIRGLQTVQNSLARIVLPSSRHLLSINLLQKLYWLPIHSRITFKLVSITYKTLSTSQPIYLRSLLDQYSPIRTCSADQHLLNRPRISTNFGKELFRTKLPTSGTSPPLS